MRVLVCLQMLLMTASLCAAEGTSFESDWQAFTAEIDGSYPFFELKGIAADWSKCKEELGRRIKTCRTDAEFLGIVADAIRVLRHEDVILSSRFGIAFAKALIGGDRSRHRVGLPHIALPGTKLEPDIVRWGRPE